MRHVAGAVSSDPADAEPYQLIEWLRQEWPEDVARAVASPSSPWAYTLASYLRFLDGEMDGAAAALGMLAGYLPAVAWTAAPWFADPRFRAGVTPQGVAAAAANLGMYGNVDDSSQDRLEPWFALFDAVCDRQPVPETLGHVAILLRACGRTADSLALCDRADAIRRIMFTEVVRGGTWRRLGDRQQTRAAFERALALDPANWSLHLDLADLAAEDGDFTRAAELAGRGLKHEPGEVSLRAAAAAFRFRARGTADDRDLLLSLAPQVDPGYRRQLIAWARVEQ